MLVNCPKCAKVYHIAPQELPAPRKIDRKGKGWFLSCQHCFHEWFFECPKGFSWYEGGGSPVTYGQTVVKKQQRFIDQTNLSFLKTTLSQDIQDNNDVYYVHHLNQNYSPFLDKAPVGYDHDPLTPQQEKKKTSLVYKITLSFMFTVFVGSVLTIFDIIQIDNVTDQIKPPSMNVIQNQILGLTIDTISFEIDQQPTDYSSVTVKWRIQNLSSHPQSLAPLKITLFGACKGMTLASSLSTQEIPYCVLKAWHHDPSKTSSTHLDPQKSIIDESRVHLPKDVVPLRAEVTFEGNT